MFEQVFLQDGCFCSTEPKERTTSKVIFFIWIWSTLENIAQPVNEPDAKPENSVLVTEKVEGENQVFQAVLWSSNKHCGMCVLLYNINKRNTWKTILESSKKYTLLLISP